MSSLMNLTQILIVSHGVPDVAFDNDLSLLS